MLCKENFLWVGHGQPQLGLGKFPSFLTQLGFISWEQVLVLFLLLRKTTMTKGNLWRSGVISCGSLQSITEVCQGRYSRQEMGTETETSAAYYLAVYGLFKLLFFVAVGPVQAGTAHCTMDSHINH